MVKSESSPPMKTVEQRVSAAGSTAVKTTPEPAKIVSSRSTVSAMTSASRAANPPRARKAGTSNAPTVTGPR